MIHRYGEVDAFEAAAVDYLLNFRITEEEIAYLRGIPQFKYASDAFFDMLAGLRFTGDVFAVGQSTTSIFSTLTEHWNGNAWSVVASPNESGGHGDFFAGVTFVPGTQDYWAVGAGVNSEDQYASALSEEYVCGTSDALPAFMHRALLRR